MKASTIGLPFVLGELDLLALAEVDGELGRGTRQDGRAGERRGECEQSQSRHHPEIPH